MEGRFVRVSEDNGGFVGDRAEGNCSLGAHCLVGVRQYSQDHVKLPKESLRQPSVVANSRSAS